MNLPYTYGRLGVDQITPDLNQPRKWYDPEKLEDLTVTARNKGILTPLVVEEIDRSAYIEFLTSLPDVELRQRYLANTQQDSQNVFYVAVVGHRRWLAALKSGRQDVPAKIVRNLTSYQRLQIQIQEDSQLPFPPWERAKSIARSYQDFGKLRELEGDEEPSLAEFARWIGESPESVRERFRYIYGVADEVKNLVEKEKTLDYRKAVLISRVQIQDPTDPERTRDEQLKVASKAASMTEQRLRRYIRDNYGEQKEVNIFEPLKPANGNGKNPSAEGLQETLNDLKLLLYQAFRMTEDYQEHFDALLGSVAKDPSFLSSTVTLQEWIKQTKGGKYLDYLRRRKSITNPTELKRVPTLVKEAYREHETAEPVSEDDTVPDEIQMIPIDALISDEANARGPMTEEGLEELKESIQQWGLINPIYIEKLDGKYKIIYGHRRYLAGRMAGLTEIEAFVLTDLSQEERLRMQLIEDSQSAFTPAERAESWYRLYTMMKENEDGLTVKEFSRRIHRNENVVRSALRFPTLHPRVKGYVEEGLLPYWTALQLSPLNEEDQPELALNIIFGKMRQDDVRHMSSREARKLVNDFKQVKLGGQTTYLTAEDERERLATVFKKLGLMLNNTYLYGLQSWIKRLDEDATLRDAVLSNEGVVRSFYSLDRITRSVSDFINSRGDGSEMQTTLTH